ncbi:MAG: tetratricopeptide repeat protein [Brumimicrobium sp.]|nr:tetratricopeptide repeat protein [Brumimicrobium sp.]
MKKIFAVILILSVFASCAISQKSKEKKLKEEAKSDVAVLSSKNYPYIDRFHQALREKLKGNTSEAKKLFEACLRENKNDDAVYFALGKIARKENNLTQAVAYFQQAYNIDPSNITYLELLAQAQFIKSDFVEAERLYKDLCEREPRNPDYIYFYCNVLIYNKSYKKAIDQINKLEDIAGIIPELSFMKADLYIELKNPKKSEEILLQLQNENPNDTEIIQKIISFYEQQGQKDKAIALFEKEVAKDSTNGAALFVLAGNYLQLNYIDKFIQISPRILKSDDVSVEHKFYVLDELRDIKGDNDPVVKNAVNILYDKHSDDALVNIAYGVNLIYENRSDEALTYFRKAITLDKSNFDIWYRTLAFESEFKEYEALYEDGNKALELFPSIPSLYYFASEGALHNKHLDEAEDLVTAGLIYCIKNNSDKAVLMARKGEIDFYRKNYKQGIVNFEQALSIHPNPIAKLIYAKTLAKTGIALEVIPEMLNSIADTDKTQDFFYTEGLYNIAIKDYKNGIKSLERIVEKTFNNADLYDLLGDMYFLSGDVKKAVTLWETALSKHCRNLNLSKKINDEKLYDSIYVK